MKHITNGDSLSFAIGEKGVGKLKLKNGLSQNYDLGTPLVWKNKVFTIERISNDAIHFSHVSIPKQEIQNELRMFVILIEYSEDVLDHKPWMSFPDLVPEKRSHLLPTSYIQWENFIDKQLLDHEVNYIIKNVPQEHQRAGMKIWAEVYEDLPF